MLASHTKLTSFRRCRRQFHWTYDLNKDGGTSTGQKVGSIGHAVLAHYYANLTQPDIMAQCLKQVTLLGQNYNLEHEDIARLHRAVERYMDFSDEYDVFDVMETEKHVKKTIGKHTIEGYIDLIAQYPDGRKICIDHKFQKRPDVGNIDLDQQLTMYIWLADLDVAMLNCINVTASKTTKMASVIRDMATRSPEYMATFLADLESQLDEMEEFNSHPEKDRYAYPNPTLTCGWDCNFYGTCKEYQQTGDFSLVTSLPPRIFDKITILGDE